jgi:hypothetical protein
MAKREFVKMTGLFSVMLMCLSVALANGNTSIGTSVPDSVADQMRGGASHNDHFKSDPRQFCEGGVCSKAINSYDSEGGTAGHTSDNCGPLVSCHDYTKEEGCNEG